MLAVYKCKTYGSTTTQNVIDREVKLSGSLEVKSDGGIGLPHFYYR